MPRQKQEITRDKSVSTRCTAQELMELKSRAKKSGYTLPEYIRYRLGFEIVINYKVKNEPARN